MRIPLTLLRDLTQYVAMQYHEEAFKPTPEVVGRAAGVYAMEWVKDRDGSVMYFDRPMVEVRFWAERFGKCLGDFYTSERKVH